MQESIQLLFKELQEADTRAFIKRINEPVFISPDLPLTQRIVNHWHLKGLLPYQKEPGKRLDFSLVDYIWVLFAKQLRNLGVALPNIEQIKDQCFRNAIFLLEDYVKRYMFAAEPGLLPKDVQTAIELLTDPETRTQLESPKMRLFSFWLMLAIKNNQDVLVRIQPDEANTTDFVLLAKEQTDTQQIVKTIAKKGGLFISIQALLNEFYGSERFTWENIQKLEIDKEARIIVSLIREKGIKEVTLKLRDGTLTQAQSTFEHKQMSTEALFNAMAGNKYTEWRVVKQAGNELIVTATKSFKPKATA